MQHILKTLHAELERTHDLVEHYKLSGIHEYFYACLGKSFKTILAKYAREKEDILMIYATLHYDISKDIKMQQEENEELEHIRIGITSLTHKMELCGNTLARLNAHSHRQEDILKHERNFFSNMLECFNADLLEWVSLHEKEIFGEISILDKNSRGKNPIESGKMLLEQQKKKLESYMNDHAQKSNTNPQ